MKLEILALDLTELYDTLVQPPVLKMFPSVLNWLFHQVYLRIMKFTCSSAELLCYSVQMMTEDVAIFCTVIIQPPQCVLLIYLHFFTGD